MRRDLPISSPHTTRVGVHYAIDRYFARTTEPKIIIPFGQILGKFMPAVAGLAASSLDHASTISQLKSQDSASHAL